MKLPNDPVMLLSVVNTRLRDNFSSLDELCAACGCARGELEKKLAAAGYEYDEGANQFI